MRTSLGARRLSASVAVAAAGCWVVTVTVFVVASIAGFGDTNFSAPRPHDTAWWVGVATLTIQAVLLLWVRAAACTVLVAVSVGVVVAGLSGLGDATNLTSIAVLVAVYFAASVRPLGAVWPAVCVAAVLVAAGEIVGPYRHSPVPAAVGGAVLQAAGTVVPALVVAAIFVARREARSARESQARALVREREALVQAALARERTAMARELHDIAAHHLSGIAVMTAAIGRQIDTDPEAAKGAVLEVRRQSTSLLRDLRSLVGLLREHDPRSSDATHVRPEALAGIAALVQDFSASGHEVELTVLSGREDGPLGDRVGPLGQLVAYRMVQESLANATRHAPAARCAVKIDDRDVAGVSVRVRNDAPTVGSESDETGGFGLVGMRERAELVGARLQYGHTDSGGWEVLLRIPRDQMPEADGQYAGDVTDPVEDVRS